MSFSRRTAATLLAAAMTLTASGAMAADGDCYSVDGTLDGPQACESTLWMTGGVGTDAVALTEDEPTSGDRSSGGMSVNAVAGFTLVGDSEFAHTVSGSYTGVLDAIEVFSFVSDPVAAGLSSDVTYRIRLSVDGRPLFDNNGGDAQSIRTTHIDQTLSRTDFAFTGLYEALDRFGIENEADTEHTITVEFSDFYYGDGNNVLYFGSAEAPSHLRFNTTERIRGTELSV